MKFICDTVVLRDAVTKVLPVVQQRTPVPVMHNLYMEAQLNGTEGSDAGTLKILATDSDVSVSFTIAAQVVVEGKTTVPAVKLGDVLKHFSKDRVETSVDAGFAATFVNGSGRSVTLRGIDPSQFPNIELDVADVEPILDGAKLASLLRSVGYAMSRDEARHTLRGVALLPEGESTVVAATDGRRMARADSKVAMIQKSIILPSKVVRVICKLTAGETEKIRLGTDGVRVQVTGPGFALAARLIDGHYPKINPIIAQAQSKLKHTAIVTRVALVEVVRLASVFGKQKGSAVVRLEFGRDFVTVDGESASVGAASGRVSAEYSGGAPEKAVTIAMGPAYLDQLLGSVEDEKVALKIGTRVDPLVMTSGDDYLGIVMPMRI